MDQNLEQLHNFNLNNFKNSFRKLRRQFKDMIKIKINTDLNRSYKDTINNLKKNKSNFGKTNEDCTPIKYVYTKEDNIRHYYFISEIEKDGILSTIKAASDEFNVERFLEIECEKAVQYSAEIFDQLSASRLPEILQNQFNLDSAKVEVHDGVVGLRVIGQNARIKAIRTELENGRQGNRSFAFDLLDCAIQRTIVKRIQVECYKSKYFRCFDDQTAKKIVEDQHKCGINDFYIFLFNFWIEIVLFDDEEYKIDTESKLNKFIYDFIISKLKTSFSNKFEDPDDTFNINNRYLWVANKASESINQDEDNLDLSNEIFCKNEFKVIQKLNETSLILLSKKLNSDEELKFDNLITRKIDLEDNLNPDIPAYLQLFCNVKEIQNELENNRNNANYVWYYEFIKEADSNVKDRKISGYKVIRLDANHRDEQELIRQLEQNFYDFSKSNENKRTFSICFVDSGGNQVKYAVKFTEKGKGNIGTIGLTQGQNYKCRNLYRYPNYEESIFEKEECFVDFLFLKLIKKGYKDPYEGCRPIPLDTSLECEFNDNLKLIQGGKIQSTSKFTYSAYLRIDQLENIERKEHLIYEQVRKLRLTEEIIRFPQKDNKMKDRGHMNIWRLGTNQGKMLDCMNSKWIHVLQEIENYVRKQSGTDVFIVNENAEAIEEEKHNMQDNANKNALQSLEIENTAQGFQALLFIAKLHFIDCIFTSSFYPKSANRNNEFSIFLYPFEWDINFENIEETTFVLIKD